jgi:hypothetical protein
MTEIKAMKLVTGEDVIAELIDNGDTITFKNPVQVTMVPSKTGGAPNFGFIPFPLTSNEKEVTVAKDKIVFTVEPAEEFRNQYNTIFGSGIITPTQGIVV